MGGEFRCENGIVKMREVWVTKREGKSEGGVRVE
jgi:hypothetical protein